MIHVQGCNRATAKFLMTSWKDGTKTQYSLYYKKWRTYCLVNKVDHVKPNDFQLCSFLRELSEKGYSAGAINAARCSLSCLLPRQENGETRGRAFWVSRAVRAAGIKNPAKPKYPHFWDVAIVFNLFQMWGVNRKLSLERLTKKLVVLLLLITGQRGQMIPALSLDELT